MSETFKLKPGEELVVTVPKKKAPGSRAGAHKKKGPISSGRRGEYLPRRKGGGVLVNFWDLGQVKDDTVWVDLPFYFNPGYVISDGVPVDNEIVTFDQKKALETLVFTHPISEWRVRHRKLSFELAERYGVDFGVGDATYIVGRPGSRDLVGGSPPVDPNKWTTDGLKLGAKPSAFTVIGPEAFSIFDLSNTDGVKITATHDYSSPAVPFTAGGAIDIFLLPGINLTRGSSIQNIGGSPPLLRFDSAFFNADILPRSWFLQDGVFASGLALQYNQFSSLYPAHATEEDIRALRDVYKARPAASLGILTKSYGYISSPHPAAPPPETGPLSEFPGGPFFDLGVNPVSLDEGNLAAVIQTNGSTFYVWNKGGVFTGAGLTANTVPS